MDPLLRKKFQRFRQSRRGFYSFILISGLFIISLFSELLCNNKPWIVSFQGNHYFPIFLHYKASTFGEHVQTHVDYKKLENSFEFAQKENWMLFPPVPFGPNESLSFDVPPPTKPTQQNWLGTDDRGRDLLTRLIYGFRNSMLFALTSWVFIVLFAYCFGGVQGYFGGKIDFIGQRLSEVWNSLPILYVIVFLLSIFSANLFMLTATWVIFSWLGLSTYVRAEVLRIRKMEFVQAAYVVGMSAPRILFKHVLPNAIGPVISFTPFLIAASISALASLDYLGLGLPPPAASWGELLRQGKENLSSWWLAVFPFTSLFITLLLLNFTGEAIRSAFNTKE